MSRIDPPTNGHRPGWHFHKWGKWGDPIGQSFENNMLYNGATIQIAITYQVRACASCNKQRYRRAVVAKQRRAPNE